MEVDRRNAVSTAWYFSPELWGTGEIITRTCLPYDRADGTKDHRYVKTPEGMRSRSPVRPNILGTGEIITRTCLPYDRADGTKDHRYVKTPEGMRSKSPVGMKERSVVPDDLAEQLKRKLSIVLSEGNADALQKTPDQE
jgi:hypothetical protein